MAVGRSQNKRQQTQTLADKDEATHVNYINPGRHE